MDKDAPKIFLEPIKNEDELSAGILALNISAMSNIDMIPDPVLNPSYMRILQFEEEFPYTAWRKWLGRHWKIAVHISFLYIMAIYVGQKYMKKRRAYELNNLLKLWNLLLAVFSLTGFVRSIPEVIHLLQRPNGFYHTCCSRDDYNAASAYWSFIGTMSKVVELGDTVFLVLRKRPVTFLHWYHHTTVMLYVWYTFEDNDPCHRLFTVVNYGIHSIMYSYYALRAMGYRLSVSVSMIITSLQILQMVGGILFNIHGLHNLSQGIQCERKLENVKLALFMYLSYLLLFAHFFYSSYFAPKKKTLRLRH